MVKSFGFVFILFAILLFSVISFPNVYGQIGQQANLDGLAGKWDVSESINARNCDGYEDTVNYNVTIEVDRDTEQLFVNFPSFIHPIINDLTGGQGLVRNEFTLPGKLDGKKILFDFKNVVIYEFFNGEVTINSFPAELRYDCNSFQSNMRWTWKQRSTSKTCAGTSVLTFRSRDKKGCFYSASFQKCEEFWQCGEWGSCKGGKQTRTCADSNSCGTETRKPAEEQECESKNYLPLVGAIAVLATLGAAAWFLLVKKGMRTSFGKKKKR